MWHYGTEIEWEVDPETAHTAAHHEIYLVNGEAIISVTCEPDVLYPYVVTWAGGQERFAKWDEVSGMRHDAFVNKIIAELYPPTAFREDEEILCPTCREDLRRCGVVQNRVISSQLWSGFDGEKLLRLADVPDEEDEDDGRGYWRCGWCRRELPDYIGDRLDVMLEVDDGTDHRVGGGQGLPA